MNKTKCLPALAALALAALLSGCAMPPYNEELSLSQVTRAKLGAPVNTIGPIYAKLDPGAMQTEFYFLPERDDPANSGGFLVAEASYGLRVWYLADYSGGLAGSWSIGLENSSETANNYLLQPIKSASSFDLSLVQYTPSDLFLSNNLRGIRALDPSYIGEAYYAVHLSSFLIGTAPLFGVAASIFPMDSTMYDYDLQYFLGYSDAVNTYCEIESRTDSSLGASSPNAMSPAISFLPAGLRNGFYGHGMNTGLSYLSYWSATEGKYKSCSWVSGITPYGLTELTGITGRIDAVLTNGQLLSFNDRSCTVYDPTGKKLYEFLLGSLRFCYERYDGGTPKLYFSLAYWLFGQEDRPDQLHVEVYAIPTDSLASLK